MYIATSVKQVGLYSTEITLLLIYSGTHFSLYNIDIISYVNLMQQNYLLT